MSITGPVPDKHGIVVTAIGHACTYCEEPAQDTAIVWHGPDGILIVHADCLGPWFFRMARDAHEIENPAFYTRRRREAP